jgi:hypothetical protein
MTFGESRGLPRDTVKYGCLGGFSIRNDSLQLINHFGLFACEYLYQIRYKGYFPGRNESLR